MARSKEAAIAAGVSINETQHSMNRRTPWHDYRQRGTYMLTLVVEGRKPLLGRLVVEPCGNAQGTVAGTAVGAGAGVGTVAGAGVCSGAGAGAASVPAASPAGIASAPAVFPAGKLRPVLFERGYCDKLLMHEGQLETWKRYLDDNPRRLAIKRLRPDYFTVINNAEVVGHSCQLVGNRFLLDIPQKMAVIVHRRYTDTEYAEYRRQWLACGEAGGVLVSAAIATREKAVMREAMDRGYHVILLRENGFPPLYKPAGEAFEACTEGRLLQISPWEYHMEHKTITRQQCSQLNKMAEDIVAGE